MRTVTANWQVRYTSTSLHLLSLLIKSFRSLFWQSEYLSYSQAMDLSELRKNLKNYNAQLEIFRLEKYLNQNYTKSLSEIEETATDLFTASTIETLEDLHENSDEQSEIEQKARFNLLNVSRLGFLKRETNEISRELEICRKAVRIKFQDQILPFSDSLKKIAFEETSENRKEIFARLIDSQNSCANLLIEKFSILQKTSQKLGFVNLHNFYEEIAKIDFANFVRKAKIFLEKTEEIYFRMLSGVALGNNLEIKKLHSADIYFLRERLERPQVFSGQTLPRLYERIFENFGFNSRKITNIEIVKASEQKRAGIFCPNPPEKINFYVSNQNGAANFTEFLRCFGRANQAAWTSKGLARRFPEFIFPPDACLPFAYGVLFQTLLTGKPFLQQSVGIWEEKLIDKIVEENKFRLLYEVRSEILKFIREIEFFGAAVSDIEEFSQDSAVNLTNNLGFEFSRDQMLFEISENFTSQTRLRGFIFAYGLREYFSEKYGFRWWTARKTFEELIDFWNTSSRYKAEEMAQMIGFEMNFDLLAETL